MDYPYVLDGNHLTVSFPEGYQLTFIRTGSAPGGSRGGAGTPGTSSQTGTRSRYGQVGGGQSALDQQIIAILTSSKWCSFSFSSNQTTGYSRTGSGSLYIYPDGTFSTHERSESSLSSSDMQSIPDNPQGTFYASQHDAEGDGRWEVRGGELYASTGGGMMEKLDFTINCNAGHAEGEQPFWPVTGTNKCSCGGSPILLIEGTEYCLCE